MLRVKNKDGIITYSFIFMLAMGILATIFLIFTLATSPHTVSYEQSPKIQIFKNITNENLRFIFTHTHWPIVHYMFPLFLGIVFHWKWAILIIYFWESFEAAVSILISVTINSGVISSWLSETAQDSLVGDIIMGLFGIITGCLIKEKIFKTIDNRMVVHKTRLRVYFFLALLITSPLELMASVTVDIPSLSGGIVIPIGAFIWWTLRYCSVILFSVLVSKMNTQTDKKKRCEWVFFLKVLLIPVGLVPLFSLLTVLPTFIMTILGATLIYVIIDAIFIYHK